MQTAPPPNVMLIAVLVTHLLSARQVLFLAASACRVCVCVCLSAQNLENY